MRIRSIRRSILASALLAVASVPADATIHSLTGNVRYQVGNGLPLPITVAPAPGGRIVAVPGATIRQHPDGGGPSRVVLDPDQLTAPATSLVLRNGGNPNVLQVKTSLAAQFPASKVSFRAGGRTGAATVTFCPGNTVTPAGNPACNPAGVIPGLLRYTRTSSQFGGPAQLAFQGVVTIALPVATSPPCTGCLAAFIRATPPPNPAVGASFGFATAQVKAPFSPGVFQVNVTLSGLITAITPTGLAPGSPVTTTSHGGPWTTGMLTISNPAAVPAQVFVFSGSDGRGPGGTGSLSLVSGAVSQSSFSGPNANRGWLNLSIGPVVSQIPAAPLPAVAAGLALMALAGAFALRRRRARAA